MSYRLIDSNEIAIKHPEVNDMDCIYVDLPNGLDNEYHYIDTEPTKHGRWIKVDKHTVKCSECGNYLDMRGVNAGRGDANFCPNCGARMDGGEND